MATTVDFHPVGSTQIPTPWSLKRLLATHSGPQPALREYAIQAKSGAIVS